MSDELKSVVFGAVAGLAPLALLFLMGVGCVDAQTLTLTPPAGAVRPGDTVTASVSFVSAPSSPAAALQWSLTIPPGEVSAVVWSDGAALTAASKGVTCSERSGRWTCVAAGQNQTPINSGVVATVSMKIGDSSQATAVNLGPLIAATPAADPLVVTAAGGFPIFSLCDLTGDGRIDTADTLAATFQALAITPCVSADITRDGKCDAVDVQRVANAATPGGSCRVGP